MPNDVQNHNERFDEGTLFWGAIIGFILGGLVWFFNVPFRGVVTRGNLRNAPRTLRDQIDQQEAIDSSIEEGKAIARRRAFTDD